MTLSNEQHSVCMNTFIFVSRRAVLKMSQNVLNVERTDMFCCCCLLLLFFSMFYFSFYTIYSNSVKEITSLSLNIWKAYIEKNSDVLGRNEQEQRGKERKRKRGNLLSNWNWNKWTAQKTDRRKGNSTMAMNVFYNHSICMWTACTCESLLFMCVIHCATLHSSPKE